MTAPEPRAESPGLLDVIAAFFAAEREAGPDQVVFGPCDRTPEAGLGHDYDGPELHSGTPEYEAGYAEYRAWADAAAEAAMEAADEWDSADSNAYQARVEAGLEPEAEL